MQHYFSYTEHCGKHLCLDCLYFPWWWGQVPIRIWWTESLVRWMIRPEMASTWCLTHFISKCDDYWKLLCGQKSRWQRQQLTSSINFNQWLNKKHWWLLNLWLIKTDKKYLRAQQEAFINVSVAALLYYIIVVFLSKIGYEQNIQQQWKKCFKVIITTKNIRQEATSSNDSISRMLWKRL